MKKYEKIAEWIRDEVEAGLSREGCTLQISVTENAVEKERMLLKEFLRTSSIDGLIAEPVKSGLPNPNLGLYRELKSAGVPVLFVNSFYPEIDIPYVSLNDQKAGYIAAGHFHCRNRQLESGRTVADAPYVSGESGGRTGKSRGRKDRRLRQTRGKNGYAGI